MKQGRYNEQEIKEVENKLDSSIISEITEVAQNHKDKNFDRGTFIDVMKRAEQKITAQDFAELFWNIEEKL